MTRDQSDPQHHTYKATFRLHSWWETNENPARLFVIVQRQHNFDTGDLETIILLERGKEWPVERPYAEIFDLYKKGGLVQVSKMPG